MSKAIGIDLGKDKDTGKEQSITITESGRMSDSEIEEAIRDAEKYAGQDQMRKDAFSTLDVANRLIAKTSETIRNAGKELDKEDKKALKADLKQLETLVMKYRPEKMNEDDIARVKEKCEKLCQTANDSGITLG